MLPDRVSTPVLRTKINGFDRISKLMGRSYYAHLESLHSSRNVTRYLEIGTRNGASLKFARGKAIAIDPNFQLDWRNWEGQAKPDFFEMTSDAFFAEHDPVKILGGPIEMAFIDGMHLAEFVLRDFINVERSCTANSLVILHDAVPGNYEMSERNHQPAKRADRELASLWTGDVWRVLPILYQYRPDLRIEVLDCRPTGLVRITNLDPGSSVLAEQADRLVASLSSVEATPDTFWDFVTALEVRSSAMA